MASSFSYAFDLSSGKKVLQFRGYSGEEYVLSHDLSWTIYGNSILNIIVECNTDKNALIIAELHSDSCKATTTTALLEDCSVHLNFQNVNLLTADAWKCVIRVVPYLQLHDLQDSATALTPVISVKKGALKKTKLDQLSSDMQRILGLGDFSDVVLSDGVIKINAHKVILSARSPVFSKMFQHPMKENFENCVMITDIPEDALKELVSFIYTGTVTLKDSKMARNLYMAADKYAVMDLRNVCSEVLQSISFDDVLDTLALAHLYEDKPLKQFSLNFIAKHYVQLKASKNWEIFMKENQALAIEILSFIIENKP